MRTEPPGPPEPPVVGSTLEYTRDPLRFVTAVSDTYGDVASFRLGPRETYLLSGPDDIETVLTNDEGLFRKADFQDDALTGLLGDGLLLSTGERWRRQRDLAQPAFNVGRIAGLVETIAAKAAATAEDWPIGEPTDVQPPIARLTVDVIVDAMFGVDVDEGTIREVQDSLEPLGARFEPDAARFLTPAWVPTPDNREYAEARETLHGVVEELVDRRRGSVTSDDQDLLSILLRARQRGDQTDEDLRAEMTTMLLAGHDTTALTLTYAFHQLGCHPAVAERLYEEIDAVVGDDRPTMADLRDLEYAGRVLKETMRLLPPVYTLFRQPNADVRLGGYRVPEDALLMLPQWVVHRDGAHYDDPLSFDPDRWRPERARERHPYAYFPFGAGPRSCIGRQFSLVEAKVILAEFLRRYRVDLASSRDLRLRPSLTMHPHDPVEVTFERRP